MIYSSFFVLDPSRLDIYGWTNVFMKYYTHTPTYWAYTVNFNGFVFRN